jgi:hypothetical protein
MTRPIAAFSKHTAEKFAERRARLEPWEPVDGTSESQSCPISFFGSVHPPPLMPRWATALNFVIPSEAEGPAVRLSVATTLKALPPNNQRQGVALPSTLSSRAYPDFLFAAPERAARRHHARQEIRGSRGTCSFTRTARKCQQAIHNPTRLSLRPTRSIQTTDYLHTNHD